MRLHNAETMEVLGTCFPIQETVEPECLAIESDGGSRSGSKVATSGHDQSFRSDLALNATGTSAGGANSTFSIAAAYCPTVVAQWGLNLSVF